MVAAKAWSETVWFKTYLLGPQDKHPMFLEHRVYQGSSGKVYPYGVTDTLQDKAEKRPYQALILENDFLKVMILPQLGGRVQRAYDKVNHRDFVYFNQVVKPAMVGLLGPWISGGIEFNWPQHHRPTTFMPVDGMVQNHEDGSASVVVSEKEPMHGLTITTTFTLPADKALLQIHSKIYNGNETARSFLWWSNPAVKGGDDHQSIFPPDVTAVFDHGKRAVIDFPIAHGEYYKVKYDGVDISRYKNLPVPTSYMAWRSNYDFVGAYSFNEEGGLLHVADHHIAPGKKQWTWGNGDFGQAWDRNLTDEDGPYIELMTGVYTDNQPDFTWIGAHESKEFTQNFMPYTKLGRVHNANTTAALKLEREEGKFKVGVYAVGYLKQVKAQILADGQVIDEKELNLSPCQAQLWEVAAPAARCQMRLMAADGTIVLSYGEHIKQALPLPEIAPTPRLPQEINSTDEAYFIAKHLEQYHHASRRPEDYYARALQIDPLDYRCNTALGQYEYERANFTAALEYANQALHRALMLNRNCECGQALVLKADVLLQQGKLDAAYDEYFRAVWSTNCKTQGFNGLATISARRGNFAACAQFAAEALLTDAQDVKALALKAYGLLKSGDSQATSLIATLQAQAPLEPLYAYLNYAQDSSADALAHLEQVLNGREINYLSVAEFLTAVGAQTEALELLNKVNAHTKGALIALVMAALSAPTKREALYAQAQQNFAAFVRFPNSVFERVMLGTLTDSAFALHLCACFDYSHRLYAKAVELWQQVLTLDKNYVDALRGIAIDACNQHQDINKAVALYRQAEAIAPNDERLLFELSLVEKLAKVPAQERLDRLEQAKPYSFKRDDLKAEYLTLLNLVGRVEDAHTFIQKSNFHVWEGGEGRVSEQYVINGILRAAQAIAKQDWSTARDILTCALTFPHNLGEGKLVVQTDNDLYFLKGAVEERMGLMDEAAASYAMACRGDSQVHEQRYYNDQKADYVFFNALALAKRGDKAGAERILQAMQRYGKQAVGAPIASDFFAVSLPDLIVLNKDEAAERDENAYLLQMLAALGFHDEATYRACLQQMKTINPSSYKAALYASIHDIILSFIA